MELSEIIPHIEALIFASDKPLSNADLLELVNSALAFIEDRATQQQVDAAIEGIGEKYNSEFYAFELKEIGGGWQFGDASAYSIVVVIASILIATVALRVLSGLLKGEEIA